MCKEGYFGPNCGCTPRDDSTGHFTCDEDGTIVCLPGYQNTTINCVEETTTVTPTTDIIPTTSPIMTDFNSYKMGNTRDIFTTDASPESDGDIVPIVAGGVAGGIVVLLLILIVNIVLVVVVIKIKYMKHYSNKQDMLSMNMHIY